MCPGGRGEAARRRRPASAPGSRAPGGEGLRRRGRAAAGLPAGLLRRVAGLLRPRTTAGRTATTLLCLAALASASLALAPAPGHAASLASNLHRLNFYTERIGDIQAQSFRTGDQHYRLDRVSLSFASFADRSVDEATVVLRIREDDSGAPGALVADLSKRVDLDDGFRNRFPAPAGTFLDPDTTYWVTVNEGSAAGERLEVSSLTDDSEDNAPGWSIGDSRLHRATDTDAWSSSDASLLLRIEGEQVNGTLLGALRLSAGGRPIALTPRFSPDRTAYTADPEAHGTVTVEASPAFRTASVSIAGDDDPTTPGEATVALREGESTTTVRVTVTAQGGNTATYTIQLRNLPLDLSGHNRVRFWERDYAAGLLSLPTHRVYVPSVSQRFRTGTDANAYRFESATIKLDLHRDSGVAVHLYSDKDGHPFRRLAELTPVRGLASGLVEFRAEQGTDGEYPLLAPGTAHHVVFTLTGVRFSLAGVRAYLDLAAQNDTSTGASGFRLDNGSLSYVGRSGFNDSIRRPPRGMRQIHPFSAEWKHWSCSRNPTDVPCENIWGEYGDPELYTAVTVADQMNELLSSSDLGVNDPEWVRYANDAGQNPADFDPSLVYVRTPGFDVTYGWSRMDKQLKLHLAGEPLTDAAPAFNLRPGARDARVPAAGTTLDIAFDNPLDGSAAGDPAASQFTVEVADVAGEWVEIPVDAAAVSAEDRTAVILMLGGTVYPGQAVRVSYRRPSGDDGGNALRSPSGLPAPGFRNMRAENDSRADDPRPRRVSAAVAAGGTTLDIVFDVALDGRAANAPPESAFTVRIANPVGDRVTVAPSAVAVAAAERRVTLTLPRTVYEHDTVRLTYRDPNPGTDDAAAIQTAAGLDAPSFADYRVSNGSTVEDPVPLPLSAEVVEGTEGEQLDIRFSQSLLQSNDRRGRLAAVLTVKADRTTIPVDSVSVDGDTLILVLADGIHGEVGRVRVSHAALPQDNPEVLRSTRGYAPSFTDFPVTNNSNLPHPDLDSPQVARASFPYDYDFQTDLGFIVLEFERQIDRRPAVLRGLESAFEVTISDEVNNTSETYAVVGASTKYDGRDFGSRSVVLELESDADADGSAVLAYTDPDEDANDTSGVIQSRRGVDAEDFETIVDDLAPPPARKPTLVTAGFANVRATLVGLRFDIPLDQRPPALEDLEDRFALHANRPDDLISIVPVLDAVSDPGGNHETGRNILYLWVEYFDPGDTPARTFTLTYSSVTAGEDRTVIQSANGLVNADDFTVLLTDQSFHNSARTAPTAPTAAFGIPPLHHTGAPFGVTLSFDSEFPVTADDLRAGLTATGGSVTGLERAVKGEDRNWNVTVTPDSAAGAVTLTLAPAEDCAVEHAVCLAGVALAEAATVEIPGRAPTRVVSAELTSGPGENGTWDTGESVEAEVVFSREVLVHGPPGVTPTLGIALDGARREAALTSTGVTDTFAFSHTVTAADDGAATAAIVADGIALNGTLIFDSEAFLADLSFEAGPVLSVADAAATEGSDATADFVVTLEPAAAETVTVDYATADGTATAPADYTATSGTLTFEAGETEKTVSVTVVDDTEEDDGETFSLELSNVSGGNAAIGDARGTATIRNDESGTPALTAEFTGVPASHGGETFAFRLTFSEDVPGLGWQTLRGESLQASGGRVRNANRADRGSNLAWTITVEPDGTEDVSVTLPATADCTATGAICTGDKRPLSAAVTATVPNAVPSGAPFTVRLAGLPASHDGAGAVSFEVHFSDEPHQYSYRTLRDETLEILQGGTAITPYVKRMNKPSNRSWTVTVEPGSKADLAIAIAATADCEQAGAVCNGDGEPLSAGVAATVPGPPGVSVADARVEEAAGATVDFAVTMSRAASETVTVDYATSDGTAEAGLDYTATSGTLTFAPGETEKTVSVPVLDDSHDEGEETFTLRLSAVSGGNAWLADAEATGTIANTDAMPQAWLARFGRTVAEQVIDAVEDRLSAPLAVGVTVSVGGEPLSGASDAEMEALEERAAAARLDALTRWLRGTEREDDERSGLSGRGSRAVTARELLTGSSFTLTGEADAGVRVSLWGRAAVSRFDGREGELVLDGEVTSAMLGADWTGEAGPGSGARAWTAGLLVSRAVGEGGYRSPGSGGTVESTLTGLFPYGRHALNERVSLWGIVGYGAGELTLTPRDGRAMRTDMDLTMGALGVRGVALEAPAGGGVELAVTSDALAVRTTSDRTQGLEGSAADATRLGLGLEGSWHGLRLGAGALTPRLEVGVRHDGGDAETGFGLDLGGGLSWFDPGRGLSATVSGRGLLTHASDDFRERGFAASFAWKPERGPRGPSLTLSRSVGAPASGGAGALLGQRHLGGLAAGDGGPGGDSGNAHADRRLELRMGYGFSVLEQRFTLTPEAKLGLDGGRQEQSLGWRLGLDRGGPGAFELRLDATRREAAGANDTLAPRHELGLRATTRW